MKPNGVSGAAVVVVLAGSVLAYSGLKNKGVASTVRTLIAGKSPSGAASAGLDIGVASGAATGTATGQTKAEIANIPTDGTAASNKALGRMLATPFGWGSGQQWADLDSLWTRESDWSNTAENPKSGAYGIAQALPPTKYPLLAQKPVSSASAQISWGLVYIKGRYGSPSAAWAHELANDWY